jgi:HSP20 family protein
MKPTGIRTAPSLTKEAVLMLVRSYPFRALDLDRVAAQLIGSVSRPVSVPLEAYRAGEEFVVHFDLPGVDAETIDVNVERNVLTVRAERRVQAGEGQQVIASERPVGRFARRIVLADTLDAARVTANYDAGVLTVRIPVAETARPHKVEITHGAPAQAVTA